MNRPGSPRICTPLSCALAACALAACATVAAAHATAPASTSPAPASAAESTGAGAAGGPAAQTAPLAGPVVLEVDLREAPRRLFKAKLRIPAQPGPLQLVYPKWIPGNHRPTGPIVDLAGLVFSAGGKTLPFRRDDVDMWRFAIDVPAGAHEVEVALELLSPPPKSPDAGGGGAEATANVLLLSWGQVVLVPAGATMQDTQVRASATLPAGWRIATALALAGAQPGSGTGGAQGPEVAFAQTTLETLVDSPLLAGAHFREVPLGVADGAPHFIDAVAESDDELALSQEHRAAFEKLVAQAQALFGARHYDAYRFLVTLSDGARPTGLEHHASSDDRMAERTWLDKDLFALEATLLPHEFAHSWNGKYRRPVGLVTKDYQEPLRANLLWVYEGLTTYLGSVLAARSGLETPEQAREALAFTAATMQEHRGRTWRPLEDTAVAVQLTYGSRSDWQAERRSADYYPEGELLWLDVDTLLRERSRGRVSLDDFCRRFFGGESSPPRVLPYQLEDVAAALDAVDRAGAAAPFDWRAFLLKRVREVQPDAPVGGIERGGFHLSYDDKPNALQALLERQRKTLDLRGSVGLDVDAKDGTIADVIPQSPADKDGLGPRMKILAVNGRRFTADRLRAAVADSPREGKLVLIVDNAEQISVHEVRYAGGLRFPHLARDGARANLIDAIFAPRESGARAQK